MGWARQAAPEIVEREWVRLERTEVAPVFAIKPICKAVTSEKPTRILPLAANPSKSTCGSSRVMP